MSVKGAIKSSRGKNPTTPLFLKMYPMTWEPAGSMFYILSIGDKNDKNMVPLTPTHFSEGKD